MMSNNDFKEQTGQKNSLYDRLRYIAMPVLIEFALIGNIFFQKMELYYFYLLFIFISILLFLNFKKKIKICFPVLLKTTYILSIIFTAIMQIFFIEYLDYVALGYGLMAYLLMPGYWLLYSLYDDNSSEKIQTMFHYLKYPMACIAILGLIQYFVSPDLFGFLSSENLQHVLWAQKLDTTGYSASFSFRVNSATPSPQICSALLGLYLCIFCSLENITPCNFFCYILYSVCGALTLCKSFVLNFGAAHFFLLKNGNTKKRKLYTILKIITIAFFIFILISLLDSNYTQDTSFDRLINIDRIFSEEQDNRLIIYQKFLRNISFWGNGIGCCQNYRGAFDVTVAESFFLQILYELGIIPFLLFVGVVLNQYLQSHEKFRPAILMAAVSCVYVHAFSSIHLIIFYSLLFAKLKTENRELDFRE